MEVLRGLDPLVVWGLFARGIGFVFLISFLSLSVQVGLSSGEDSPMPIARRFAKIAQDFPTWRRFVYFPSLLWLGSSAVILRLYTWLGIAASIAVMYGGPYAFWGLATCYVVYLTLDMAMVLIFPWDALLFETTLLALFLPQIHALPELRAVEAPAPLLAWAFRLLVFRVMFGFGKQKFVGSRAKDLAYLKGFLVGQPLPSPAGWYLQKLPTVLLKGGVLFMLFAEIPAPFFAFFPGPLSTVFALATVALMIGIQVTGSYGYFSLITIVTSLSLLDNVTPRALDFGHLFGPGAYNFTNAYVLLHTLGAIFSFPFNSWMAQSWHQWAVWYQLPKFVQVFPLGFMRLLHPFRWVHAYGVFPPNNWPAVKMSLLCELTWDKATWHEVRFSYSPSQADSPPKFVAPHHPRGDQAVIYETMGLNATSLIAGFLGPWDPYPFGSRGAAPTVCQHVLQGVTFDFLKAHGLEDKQGPPVAVRMTTILLEPVSLAEHRRTGNWWKRTYVGPHLPPTEKDPDFWKYCLAEPELWHFDAIFWRRRSRFGKVMERSLAGNEDPMRLVLEAGDELRASDVELFWSEFVPMIGGPTRERFATLPDVVPEIRRKFPLRERRAMQRLLGRFSALLVARLEPMYLHRGLKPLIPVPTYFHLWMLAQFIIGSGKDAYLAAMADPRSVVKYVPEMTNQSALYASVVFRYEETIFEAQKLRLMAEYAFPHDQAAKAHADYLAKVTDLDALPPDERFFVRILRSLSGFFSVVPDIRDEFKGPRFDHGYPELYPQFAELDSGEVVVSAYRKADGTLEPNPRVTAAAAE